MADPQLTPDTAQAMAASGYSFGPFRLNTASYELFRDDQPIELTSKVFDTLLFLIRQRHRVVTKDELLSTIWRDAAVTDDSLIQCVSALRRALGDDATKPQYVATVARRGYRFIAPVSEWVLPIEAPSAVITASGPVAVAAPPEAPAPPRTSRTRPLWPIAAGVMLLAGWWAGSRFPAAPEGADLPAGVLRFSQMAPPGTRLASGGALSPDGSYLAFAAEGTDGQTRLWVRPLDAPDARPLAGTDGASRPFWSPDSRFLGFFANGRLKTTPIMGGPPTELVNVGPRASGGAWGAGGQIIYSTWLNGLSAISASGGEVRKLTELASGEAAHAWPQFLPDGDHYIYSVFAGNGGVRAGRLSTGEQRRLLDADAGAVYSPNGYLVFIRRGILTAQQFDPASLELSGEPFNVATGTVVIPTMTNGTIMSASTGGLLAFGGATGQSEMAWFDRTGKRLGALTTPVEVHNPILSGDQRQLFANSYPPGQSGIWAIDLERGASNRLAPEPAIALPSADSQRLIFTSSGRRPNVSGIFSIPLSASAGDGEEALVLSPETKALTYSTNDGRYLLYQTFTAGRGQDLWMVPQQGDRKPVPLLQTAANEIQGQVSPDGSWLAYASDESGKFQVYVQAFPGGEQRQTISPAGGAEPIWRADGREL
jgi:DNA-binding winged helix-turn-helix (wHTH) protein